MNEYGGLWIGMKHMTSGRAKWRGTGLALLEGIVRDTKRAMRPDNASALAHVVASHGLVPFIFATDAPVPLGKCVVSPYWSMNMAFFDFMPFEQLLREYSPIEGYHYYAGYRLPEEFAKTAYAMKPAECELLENSNYTGCDPGDCIVAAAHLIIDGLPLNRMNGNWCNQIFSKWEIPEGYVQVAEHAITPQEGSALSGLPFVYYKTAHPTPLGRVFPRKPEAVSAEPDGDCYVAADVDDFIVPLVRIKPVALQ